MKNRGCNLNIKGDLRFLLLAQRVKASACNAGNSASISEFRNFPRERNGYPLQYSGLVNSMDRGAWQAIVHGVTEELDVT